MYNQENIDLRFRQDSRLGEKTPEEKAAVENILTELRKVMSSVPCADEKYALYAKLHQMPRQYE